MKNIAIDGREANVKNRVGINVYAFEVIKGIYDLTTKNKELNFTILLPEKPIDEMPMPRENWQYKVVSPKTMWTQWGLPIHLFLNKKNYDVFFTPSHYAPRICPVPYISSVMDTAYLDFPDQFKKSDTIKLTKWTEYSVHNARKILTISEYTKKEVLENYDIKEKNVFVAYPAVDHLETKYSKTKIEMFLKKHKIKQPYFLYVGTIQPRKNLEKLVEAFEIYCRMSASENLHQRNKLGRQNKNEKAQLVIAGKTGWLSEPIMNKISNSPFKKRIIVTGFVSEDEKSGLYENATATILIGLKEGFGIPPLESMQFGTVPIVSNTTSLPEVVGKAGFLVDPNNTKEIAHKMQKAYQLTLKEKAHYRKLAREQSKKFSWTQSAEIILKEILEVVET